MRVLGIDPGAAHTGLVLVDTVGAVSVVHRFETVVLEPRQLGVPPSRDRYHVAIRGWLKWLLLTWSEVPLVDLIAVEDVVPPKGFRDGKRAPINPGSLIGTAAVLGLVTGFALEHGIRLQVVPPGGNGSGPLGLYPPALVSAAEKRGQGWETRQAGKGALCHVRSAWDVAVVGARMAGVAA